MAFDFLKRTYANARPDLTADVVAGVVEQALERARGKHSDFERFEPGVEWLSLHFFTAHTKMPLDDYLETLYCAVKHGDFSRSWRAHLRSAPAPAPAAVQ